MGSPIRITGMNSGMDTDSMVQELVKVQSTKKEKLQKAQTRLEWKQDAWKELNKKVKSFYNKTLDNLRFSGAYTKKKTTVGDSRIASVVSSSKAVNGTQTMAVKQLAKSGYLTGGKLSNDGSVKETTTLATLTGGKIADDAKLEYKLTVGGEEKTITLNGKSTVKDLVKAFNDNGVNATFDETNQRIFVSAIKSGKANDFEIKAGNTDSLVALAGAGLLTSEELTGNADINKLSAMYAASDDAIKGGAAFVSYADEKAAAKAGDIVKNLGNYAKAIEEIGAAINENTTKISELDTKLAELQTKIDAESDDDKKADLEKEKEKLEADRKSLEDNNKAQNDSYEGVYKATLQSKADLEAYYGGAIPLDVQAAIDEAYAKVPQDYKTAKESEITANDIRGEAEAEALSEVKAAHAASDSMSGLAGKAASRIAGDDAVVILNGVEYTSDTNAVTVNGLTITANSVSEKDSNGDYIETTINTADDVDGVYDMIKNFFKEYNDLIKEMDEKYNAESDKGYEPLTDEEKEAMSEEEVKKWEEKIKTALLRKDSNLNTTIQAMKNAMAASFTIDGKSYSLSSFGIGTLGYFNASENEHGVYHIDGDEDDEDTSSNADKLKAMISTNPDLVKEFFSKLTDGVYKKIDKLMDRTDYRSKYNVYDDKAMKNEYDDYKKKISEQETYLEKLQDRYYDQFTAMEKAMAELNSKQSALGGILGM